MRGGLQRPVRDAVRACYEAADGLDSFRARLLARLRHVLPIDAAFFAAVDPETLLFTAAWAEAPLEACGPRFLDNEFGAEPDVNRFADLARARVPAATLAGATRGDLAGSVRSREIMAPLGLGDELRVALRTGPTCWGVLCLHREGPTPFSRREVAAVSWIAPHAGAAIRRIVAASLCGARPGSDAEEAGVVVVRGDRVAALSGGAAARLEELGNAQAAPGDPAPLPLLAVVRKLETLERLGAAAAPATATLLTRRASILEAHAARLRSGTGESPVVVTLVRAGTRGRTSLRLAAYGLTPAQRRVAELVLRGFSTKEIATALRVAEQTVHDHLRAVFARVGVSSRRALVWSLIR